MVFDVTPVKNNCTVLINFIYGRFMTLWFYLFCFTACE